MTKKTSRPISPHLTIYRPQISSVLSISHRLSGVFLYVGLLISSWYIISAIIGQGSLSMSYVTIFEWFFASIIGKISLFFWVLAFYYHFCNGIRHLFWDIGKGFEIASVKRSGLFVVAIAFILTFYSLFLALGKF